MGYTHYYEFMDWNHEDWQSIWPQLVEDTKLIIENAKVPLKGPRREGCSPDGTKRRTSAPLVSVEKGINFNGKKQSHDEFILSKEECSLEDCFCKTARKPYDLVVCCVLLRASYLAWPIIQVSSDGDWEHDWKEARDLYVKLWPEDEVACPWDEADDEGEDDGDEEELLEYFTLDDLLKMGAEHAKDDEQGESTETPSGQ